MKLSTVSLASLLAITAASELNDVAPTTTFPSGSTTQHVPSVTPTGDFETTQYDVIPGITNGQFTQAPQTMTFTFATCIQTVTADKNGYLPPGTCNALWDYYPSFTAAAVFAALFGALTIGHVAAAVKYKKKFCWVVISFGVWETIAFVFRTISTKRQNTAGIYLVFQIFILLGPLWVNAFGYMVLGRMIYFFLPSKSLLNISASTLAAGFVSLDFIALVVQLIGGSWAGPTAPVSEQMKGIHIYMGGIAIQQFFILVFYVLAARFQAKMTRMEKFRLRPDGLRTGWRRLLFTLYTVLGLITVRILFRLIEFSAGSTASNPAVSKEAYFFVFEAVPMLLALLAFIITHPGTVLQGSDSEPPSIWAAARAKFALRRGHRRLQNGPDEQEMARLANT